MTNLLFHSRKEEASRQIDVTIVRWGGMVALEALRMSCFEITLLLVPGSLKTLSRVEEWVDKVDFKQ